MDCAAARTRSRRVLALVFIAWFAATQALLWYAYYGHGAKALIGDEAHYQASALSILGGGVWMPSTIWPPLQPLLLALIYRVFGVHLVAVQIVQTLLLIGCAALLRDLWRRVGGSVAAANMAAALFLLNPATLAYAHWLWPETAHLFFLLATFCLLARSPSRLRAWLAGACVGFAILAKSLLAPFWPLFLIAFVRRERPRIAFACIVSFVLGIALVTAPALVRGWRTSGKPMIADSSIYNLWVGLNDSWRSDYVADMGGVTLPAFLASAPTPQQRNAIYEEKIRALLAERGIVTVLAGQISRQYFRLLSAKTPLLSQLPGRACAGHLSVYTSAPWVSGSLSTLGGAFHALTLGFAAFGIACWRWRKRWAPARAIEILIALFFAYQFALFALIHVKARFVLPMMPFLCGFAASFLVACRARLSLQRAARAAASLAGDRACSHASAAESNLQLTWPRMAVGALLAATVLFLAFAGPALDQLCAR